MTYVLVHGAFHGGWCWRRVAERLRSAGHEVYTPTLTGLGERSHLLDSSVDLDTHIEDVANVLRFEDLREVVLVGHSYAGIIISGVADRMPERLKKLVFLDAVVIDNDDTWGSIHPPQVFAARMKEAEERIAFAVPPPEMFGIECSEDREWAARHLTPHPAGTYLQPLRLEHAVGNGIEKMYVDCTKPPLTSLDRVKARVRAEDGWRIVEIASGHDAMITAPEALTAILC